MTSSSSSSSSYNTRCTASPTIENFSSSSYSNFTKDSIKSSPIKEKQETKLKSNSSTLSVQSSPKEEEKAFKDCYNKVDIMLTTLKRKQPNPPIPPEIYLINKPETNETTIEENLKYTGTEPKIPGYDKIYWVNNLTDPETKKIKTTNEIKKEIEQRLSNETVLINLAENKLEQKAKDLKKEEFEIISCCNQTILDINNIDLEYRLMELTFVYLRNIENEL